MLVNSLVAIAATATLASAGVVKRADPSVKFSFPKQRETNGDETYKGPCSGSVMGDRTDFPLTGGQISVTQRASIDNLNFLWTKDTTQTPFEFKTYGEETVVDAEPGHYCADGPDFASLGFKAGDEATLMMMYQADGPPRRGTDKRWQYICADVKLVDNWTKPTGFMCATAGDIRVAKPDEVMNVTISSENTGKGRKGQVAASDSGLSPAKAGGIGAGVTIGVVLLALAALYAAGMRIRKKGSRVTMDDSSSTSSVPVKQAQH